MGPEWTNLDAAAQAAVSQAVAKCERTGQMARIPHGDTAEAYAYPHTNGTAWGYDGPPNGFNVARGIKR